MPFGDRLKKGKVHASQRPQRPELIPVSLARSMLRSIATPPLDAIAGLHPSSMLPVPIYTPGWGETKWSKVPCLKKQCTGRGLNPRPPSLEFEVLNGQLQTPRQKWKTVLRISQLSWILCYLTNYISSHFWQCFSYCHYHQLPRGVYFLINAYK